MYMLQNKANVIFTYFEVELNFRFSFEHVVMTDWLAVDCDFKRVRKKSQFFPAPSIKFGFHLWFPTDVISNTLIKSGENVRYSHSVIIYLGLQIFYKFIKLNTNMHKSMLFRPSFFTQVKIYQKQINYAQYLL